jgi:glycosyltransferase involved in cell wall biosynthesis
MSFWEDPSGSYWLLGGYLGLLSLVWLALIAGTRNWGRKWQLLRPALDEELGDTKDLVVSVCIPARNESANIDACVRAVLASRWPQLEVIVVDDRSEDDTAAIALAAGQGDERLHVVAGVEPPAGWAGKPWACSRAAGEARGQIFCFVDADVQIAPDAIQALVVTMVQQQLRLLSVYGSWTLHGFWERLLIPAVGWLIRGAIDLDIVNDSGRPEAFANGQLIMVERQAYESLNGHQSVRDQILEDVRLAEQFKRHGFAVGMRVAAWAFQVRLYDGLNAIVRGYAKNLFEGMGRQPSMALGAVLFIFVGALLPWLALCLALVARFHWGWTIPSNGWLVWCAVVCSLQIVFRWCLEVRDGRAGRIAWAHPLANVLLVWILLRSMTSMKAQWKGRVFVDGRAQS